MDYPRAKSTAYPRALDTALVETLRNHPVALAFAMVVVDGVALLASFWLAYQIRYGLEIGGQIFFWDERPFSEFQARGLLFVGLSLLILAFRGVYRLPRWSSLLDEALVISGAITLAMAGVIMANYLSNFSPSRLLFIYAWLIAIVLLVALRFVRRSVMAWLWERSLGVERVLVVGSGDVGRRVAQAVMAAPASGLRIAGFADSANGIDHLAIGTANGVKLAPRLGGLDDLTALVTRNRIDEVLIALPPERHHEMVEVSNACRNAGVRFKIVPDLLQMAMERADLTEFVGVPLLEVRSASITGVDAALKRAVDLLVALPLSLVLGLPMLIRVARDRRRGTDPIFVHRDVIGRNGATLTLRTFALEPGAGHWQRLFASSPLLLQVVRGEMSLVGPLAQSRSEVDQYQPWQRSRLKATPGLTGYWLLSDPRDLTFEEMVRLDLFYAEHWSPMMDTKILLRTALVMLKGGPNRSRPGISG